MSWRDFRIVADYFVQMRKKRAYETYDGTAFTHPDEILKLMSILDGNQKFENAINAFKTEKKGVTINMIDVFEQAEERGVELTIIKLARKRFKLGKSAQEIADDLDEDPVLIQMIISAINECPDNASDRDIYIKLHESE